jgi:ATP-binding cassette subfamily B protein
MKRSIGLEARRTLFAGLGRMQGLRNFEDPKFHDRLRIAAENGPASPPEIVSNAIAAAQAVLTMAAFMTALATLSPWMLVVVVVAALPTLRAEVVLSRHRARMYLTLGHAARREFFYADLLANVTAAKEVRLFGLNTLFGARMLTELRRVNAGHRRLDRRQLIVQCTQAALGAIVATAGLMWIVNETVTGRSSIGDVSIFVAAVGAVQGGLVGIFANAGRTHEAVLLFKHFQSIADAKPDLAVPATPALVTPLSRGIELRGVSFRYGEDLPWVLREVTMTIPAGRSTALVGRNGAGKSTLVKLLCRFYDPTHGTILWDGTDLRELPVDELRERIGAVFQDYMSYELSAADNIGLGDVAAIGDRERIAAAAEKAGCGDFISALPLGYDTMLTRVYMDESDRDDPRTGVVLSGGQWQRLALARALMRRTSDFLILDEPNAGLDAQAEYEIRGLLKAQRLGSSSLLISHRLNAVRDADGIVVIANGEVVEEGSHDDLIAAGGDYATLFARQASGYEM